jgi:hypothetical protein
MSTRKPINIETRDNGIVLAKLPRLMENHFRFDSSFRNATAFTRIKKISVITN